MRLPVRVLWLSASLLPAFGCATWAQTPAGTLQAPAKPQHDQPTKPPTAAPRTPVQKAAPAKPPVSPSHGPTHAQKPTGRPGSNVAAKPAPPTPAPPAAPDDAKIVPAEKLPDPEKPEGVPSKLPRFASLRSDDVNMRAGPGTRYRIDWVYKRRDLPVQIEREFDVWRWVRDADGIQGWVHQATLMGRRSFIVQKSDATLRSDANDSAAAVAVLKPGVVGRIRTCPAASDWCEVQSGTYRGYLRREAFWGALPGETVNP